MIKKLIILLILINFCFAKDFDLKIHNPKVANAQTVLVTLKALDIKEPKLTFKDKVNKNFNLYKNPFYENSYYALIPISYYQKKNTYRVIVSFIKNEKKVFKGLDVKVVDENYKSEVINVKPSKLKPSKQRLERTKKEYKEAIKIYKSKSEKILWQEDFINPLNSKITSPFGTKRVYNGSLKSYHSGTDYRAKIGTPIIASNSGIIKISQDRFYSGNSIVIDHGHGVYSCYFHLSKMNYKVGDFIKKGEVLGLSGDTGRITGPHLHYTIRIHGIIVDPLHAMKVLNKLRNNI